MNENIEFLVFGRKRIGAEWSPAMNPGLDKLYYVYDGEAYYNGMRLEPGHLYIFPESRGKWELRGSFDHLYFDFFPYPPLMISGVIDLDIREYPGIKAVCDAASALFTVYKRREVVSEAKLTLEILLGLIGRTVRLRSTGDGRVDRAIEYISACVNDHGGDGLTGRELAGLVNLDRFYFSKLFREKTGTTPGKFSRGLRMKRAAAMLRSGATVTEAALAAGFLSDAAFVCSFRKYFGVTPGKFRVGKPDPGSYGGEPEA